MKEVAIIGMGTMGSAIHELLSDKFEVKGFNRQSDLSEVKNSDIAIVAVKPQSFSELAAELKVHINKQLIVSIMAGLSIYDVKRGLGTDNVVRTMPNLALGEGKSMTAWYTEAQDVEDQVLEILDSWGKNVRLNKEEQFNAFTAFSASALAYYYVMADALEEAAAHFGFSADEACEISVETLKGAACVLDSGISAKDLIKRVASKGGTTEAGLSKLEAFGFKEAINQAVEAARKRSEELGK